MPRTNAIGYLRIEVPGRDHKRIKQAARRRDMSMLKYAKHAVLERVDRDETEWDTRNGSGKEPKKERTRIRFDHDGWDPPTGLGTRARKHEKKPRRERLFGIPATPAAPAPTPPLADELDRFIHYVTAVDGRERDERVDEVVRIIKDTSASESETKRILAVLDERLAKAGGEVDTDHGDE